MVRITRGLSRGTKLVNILGKGARYGKGRKLLATSFRRQALAVSGYRVITGGVIRSVSHGGIGVVLGYSVCCYREERGYLRLVLSVSIRYGRDTERMGKIVPSAMPRPRSKVGYNEGISWVRP